MNHLIYSRAILICFLNTKNKQTNKGVMCHTVAFAIYIKKCLKAKEEFMETQI